MEHPFEIGLRIGTRWVLAGVAVSLAGLVAPLSIAHLQGVVLVHLIVLTSMIIALTARLYDTFSNAVFHHHGPFGRRLGTDAALVALVTGATALVTLASSAALRYQPSLQLLQLLSAMDIAWTTSGFFIGVGRWRRSRAAGLGAGVFMGTMCVMSLGMYLARIGLGSDGGWTVEGPTLVRTVIPADVVAALLTVGALIAAARKAATGERSTNQPTLQRSPQS
jgi:hypothetical protein